jgi:hypothetical protein
MEYIDEEIPELDVREYIGKGQPGSTNVYTDNELITLLYHLLRSELKESNVELQNKAILIANYLKTLSVPVQPTITNLVYKVLAQRKDYSEAFPEYIESVQHALEETSYEQRLDSLMRIYFPIETDSQDHHIRGSEVLLEDDSGCKVLADETLTTTITQVAKREKLASNATLKQRVEFTPSLGTFKKYDSQIILPNWSEVEQAVKGWTVLPTINDLSAFLEKEGYDWSMLSKDHWMALSKKLSELSEFDEEMDDKEDTSKNGKTQKQNLKLHSHEIPTLFLLKHLLDSLDSLQIPAPETLEIPMTGMIPPIATIPARVDTLLEQLLVQKSLTLDTVIQTLRDTVQQQYQSLQVKFMTQLKQIQIEEVRKTLEGLLEKAEALKDSKKTPPLYPMPVEDELHEIVQGENTRTYEGGITGDEEYTFSNKELGEVFTAIEPDPTEDTSTENFVDSNQYPWVEITSILTKDEALLKGLTKGAYEILMGCHLRWIPILIDAGMTSCIDPILFKELYLMLGSTLQISSIEDGLANVSGLTPEVQTILLQAIVKGKPYPNLGLRPSIGMELKTHWHSYEKTYHKELYTTFTRLFALFGLTFMKQALQNNFPFNPLQGSIAYIPFYSPFGTPLETNDREGLFIYLCAVAEKNTGWSALYSRYDARSYLKRVISTIEEEAFLKERLEELKVLHRDYVVEEPSIVDAARQSLVEAIQQGDKQRILPSYLKVLLYLPRVIANPKRGNIYGCCLQNLNEQYQADQDLIANKLKALIKVKDKYAKGRRIIRDRLETYTYPEQELPELSGKIVQEMPKEYQFEFSYYSEWMKDLAQYLDLTLLPSEDKIRNTIEQRWTQLVRKGGQVKEARSWFFEQVSFENLLYLVPKWLQILLNMNEIGVRQTIIQSKIVKLKTIKDAFEQVGQPKDSTDLSTDIVRFYLLNAIQPDSQSQDVHFEEGLFKRLFEIINTVGKSSYTPPAEEFGSVIAELREKLKLRALSVLDVQTDDDRALLITLKELGIKDYVKEARYEEEEDEEQIYFGEEDEEEI